MPKSRKPTRATPTQRRSSRDAATSPKVERRAQAPLDPPEELVQLVEKLRIANDDDGIDRLDRLVSLRVIARESLYAHAAEELPRYAMLFATLVHEWNVVTFLAERMRRADSRIDSQACAAVLADHLARLAERDEEAIAILRKELGKARADSLAEAGEAESTQAFA